MSSDDVGGGFEERLIRRLRETEEALEKTVDGSKASWVGSEPPRTASKGCAYYPRGGLPTIVVCLLVVAAVSLLVRTRPYSKIYPHGTKRYNE